MSSHQHVTAQTGAVKDPVCGMDVDPQGADHHADYHGQTYVFCSENCRAKFVADPASYVGPGSAPSQASPPASVGAADVEYTCPMHPEIRQLGPGACPICGMALDRSW